MHASARHIALPFCLLASFAAVPTAACAQQPAAPMPMEHKPSAPSTSLAVSGNGKSLTLTVAELRAMPQHSVTVRNGHSGKDEVYSGVAVADLLGRLGLSTEPAGRKQVLHSYLRASGTDGYFVVFSAAELEPMLRDGDAIVALTEDAKPLEADGQMKLITAGEKLPARWVRNLSGLTVVTLQ